VSPVDHSYTPKPAGRVRGIRVPKHFEVLAGKLMLNGDRIVTTTLTESPFTIFPLHVEDTHKVIVYEPSPGKDKLGNEIEANPFGSIPSPIVTELLALPLILQLTKAPLRLSEEKFSRLTLRITLFLSL